MEKLLYASTTGKTTTDHISTLWTCHCGGFAIINEYEGKEGAPTQFQAECQTCGCCGAYGKSLEQATFHWNILADASFSRTKNVADVIREHAKQASKDTHCDHCGKKLAEGEGTHYEQGLLCNECPDKNFTVYAAETPSGKLYEKTAQQCIESVCAWISDEEGAITIEQEHMTVGDFYSLPEFQG